MKVGKFLLLPYTEKHVFLRALFLLLYFRYGLRKWPLQTIISEIQDKSLQHSSVMSSKISARKITGLIVTAARYVPYTTCLSKALAGKKLFAMYGYLSSLHIGVSKDSESRFEAHAWLTLEGDVILCYLPDMVRFREFPQIFSEVERYEQMLRKT